MKVCTLIPAYNEARTIANVIEIVKSIEYISNILVVDDGSRDNTALVAKNAGASVISHEKNRGKGAALQTGVENLDCDTILMLDADLIGLKQVHIDTIMEPMFNENIDMSVGVFEDGRSLTDLAQHFTPSLSGQRAVRKEIFYRIGDLRKEGFGVEIALNKYVKKNGKVKFVQLPKLTHMMKEEKMGFWHGFIARVGMYFDIFITLLRSFFRK